MFKQKENNSLYRVISSAVKHGELPEDFSLPRNGNDNGIVWADGALDGVTAYHMSLSEPSEEEKALMADAVQAAAQANYEQADELFCKLGEKARALSMIDLLQQYVIDHRDELNLKNLHLSAFHLITDSDDRECVKFGLSLLELFKPNGDVQVKDIVRTVGLSDEFTLFAFFVMQKWEDGNNEIWKLAQRVHGWGRIHAVERIEPDTEEIRRWFLLEGVHNKVMDAYSALTCWEKSGAEAVLMVRPTREEFTGLRDIMNGLLDEGPVQGLSGIENRDAVMEAFLNTANQMPLDAEDYETIRGIRDYFEDEDHSVPELVDLCRKLLTTEHCKATIAEAVKKGESIPLAKQLGLDYRADVFAAMKSDFEKNYHLCRYLMEDAAYKEAVLKLFRQKLPLSKMKTAPTTCSLGLGHDYWKQNALELLMQELRQYPLEGQEFVETGLQSSPIRTRNGALSVLESWISSQGKPLSDVLPGVYDMLCRLQKIEPEANVKARMERLIEGSTSFEII